MTVGGLGGGPTAFGPAGLPPAVAGLPDAFAAAGAPLWNALDASASGLSAERLRMDVVANNIANLDTTSTPAGGPYRREVIFFAPAADGVGVSVTGIGQDLGPLPVRYDPGSPQADAQGFVRLPNVDLTAEMVDMLAAARAYAANVTAFNDGKAMLNDALRIGG